MYNRVLSPSMQTVYTSTFTKKPINRVRGNNLSLVSTTNSQHYCSSEQSLYRTDIEQRARTTQYVRRPSAKMELVKLPDEYASTVKPQLNPVAPDSTYHHCFGGCGEKIAVKTERANVRQLSKQTQANIIGTPKITHYPPHYTGHIPSEWKGNRGKNPRQNNDMFDLLYQNSDHVAGYKGYVPSVGMESDLSGIKHTDTTYRSMCSAVHFEPK